jgi:predicted Zn-dependent protease
MNSIKNLAGMILLWIGFTACGNQTLTKLIPLSFDELVGDQAEQTIGYQFRNAKPLSVNEYPEAYKQLNHIKNKILNSGKVKHAKDFNWELTILHDDSMLNAFCLPGGKMYVFTGLIKYLDTEDALAGVIGHEIAHADCRHGTAQMVKNFGLSLVLKLIFGIEDGGLVGLGANLLSLGFSRSDESEADEKSVEYLSATDYDARGAAKFFEKMVKEQKNPAVLAFLSTHPDSEQRIKAINKHWEKLGSKPGKTYTKEYKKLKNVLP